MAITQAALRRAEHRTDAEVLGYPHASSAKYDGIARRIIVDFDNGYQLRIPPKTIEGLQGATKKQLSLIEIEALGLSLYWPELDADLYLPTALMGVTGSRSWMQAPERRRAVAAALGAQGGKARTEAKAAASRDNGKKGGRPKKAKEPEHA